MRQKLFRAGRSTWIALLVLSLGSIARADRLERERFSVEFDHADAARAASVARLFAETVAQVEAALGARVPDHVVVRLSADDRAFDRDVARIAGYRPPTWAIAVALPEASEVVVRAARLEAGTPGDLPTTLAHEVAHLALAPAGGTMPHWLDEGLAMWASGRKLTRDERQRLGMLARTDELPRLAELAHAFPPHAERAGTAYLLSLAFVEMLEADGGAADVRALVARLARGESLSVASAKIGSPVEGMEPVLREELARAYSPWDEILDRGSLFGLTAVLAVVVAWVYRRRRRRALAALDAAEAAPEAPREVTSIDGDDEG